MKTLLEYYRLLRKSIIVAFLLFFGFNLKSQSIIYTCDFESGTTNYTLSTFANNNNAGAQCGGSTNALRLGSGASGTFWVPMFNAQAGYTYYVTVCSKAPAFGTNVTKIYIDDNGTNDGVGAGPGPDDNAVYTCSNTANGWNTENSSIWTCTASAAYSFAFKASSPSAAIFIDNITIYEVAPACSYPSTQASFTAVTNVGSDRATVSWNRGNGNNVLIVGRKSTSVQAAPVDAANYTANASFGSGSQIGTGNFVVYKGTGNSVTVTDLDATSTYSFYAYEFNNTGPCYKVAGAITGTTTTRSTKYYVNNGSTSGDVFCTATGSNSAFRGTRPSSPVASLTWLLSSSTYSSSISVNDTIYVDAGTYSDVGVNISIDGLKIIGAGNKVTLFSSNNASGYFMNILANNVLLKNILVQNYGYSSGGLGLAQAITIGNSSTTYTGIVLYDVQIDKNGGSSGGMAVHVLANTTSTITAGGATCNNSNQTYSGGINVIGNNINLLISNYVFSNNGGDCFGGTAGGALKITGGNSTQKVEIRNCTFDKNEYCSSTFNAMDIYMVTGDLKVYDSKFNNSSSSYASGTAVGGSIGITGGNVFISGSIFTNHRSTGGMRGCAIGNAGGTVTLQTCYFSGNNANKADDVHNSSGTINATDCTWNEIGQTGGTFTISNSGNPTVFEGSVVKTNTTSPAAFIAPVTPVVSGTCGISFTILPIELTRFDGDCNNGEVILTWQTASEKNNKLFNVERSLDGISFFNIGSVKGAGSTEAFTNYVFKDSEKIDGLVYYKLSQMDYTGRTSQSKIISVEHQCGENTNTSISIFPNPTSNNTVLSLNLIERSSIYIEIYNGIGQLVKSTPNQIYELGLQDIKIETDELLTGIYFIKTIIDKKEYVNKIVKL